MIVQIRKPKNQFTDPSKYVNIHTFIRAIFTVEATDYFKKDHQYGFDSIPPKKIDLKNQHSDQSQNPKTPVIPTLEDSLPNIVSAALEQVNLRLANRENKTLPIYFQEKTKESSWLH